MTWLNPVALVGLLAVSVPILVHLFGRRVAKRQRFPSLRLLELATTTPVTRTQPSDLLLLVVRCAVITAAALGLAQPLWSSVERDRALIPARVVIVDTSESMRRLTSDGRSALVAARALGRALLDSARVGMLIETGRVGRNVAAAGSWLQQQSGRREAVVISDMQLGAVNAGDFARVPDGIGIVLTKVATRPSPPLPVASDSAIAVTMDSAETGVTWRTRAAAQMPPALTILAADSTREGLLAAVRQLVPDITGNRPITLVFPDYQRAGALAERLTALDEPWEGDLLLALRSDPLLRTTANAPESPGCPPGNAARLHNHHGSTLGAIGTVPDTSGPALVVISCVNANTSAGIALVAAVARVAGAVPGSIESDPVTIPDELLRRWERPATDVGPRGPEETSPDGRWFWLLALLLLVVEEWLRRRAPLRKSSIAVTERQERVA